MIEHSEILAQINSGQGTMGKLIKNDSLYNNLNKSSEDLDKLLLCPQCPRNEGNASI